MGIHRTMHPALLPPGRTARTFIAPLIVKRFAVFPTRFPDSLPCTATCRVSGTGVLASHAIRGGHDTLRLPDIRADGHSILAKDFAIYPSISTDVFTAVYTGILI